MTLGDDHRGMMEPYERIVTNARKARMSGSLYLRRMQYATPRRGDGEEKEDARCASRAEQDPPRASFPSSFPSSSPPRSRDRIMNGERLFTKLFSYVASDCARRSVSRCSTKIMLGDERRVHLGPKERSLCDRFPTDR